MGDSGDSGMRGNKWIVYENIIHVSSWVPISNHGKIGKQEYSSNVIVLGGREGEERITFTFE